MISPDREDRARAFSHQLTDWVDANRPGVPVFALPDEQRQRLHEIVAIFLSREFVES